MRRLGRRTAIGAVVIAMLACPAAARSASAGATTSSVGTITNFASNTGLPWDFVLGPDGAIWFTNRESNSIGRITPTGAITSFRDATIGDPMAIAVGSDGALWFANSAKDSIGRITTT